MSQRAASLQRRRERPATDAHRARGRATAPPANADASPRVRALHGLEERANRNPAAQHAAQLRDQLGQRMRATPAAREVARAAPDVLQQAPAQVGATHAEAGTRERESGATQRVARWDTVQADLSSRGGMPIQRQAAGPIQFFGLRLLRGAARTLGLAGGAWAGAKTGAALGSYLGPYGAAGGALLGGLVGGIAGYSATGAGIDAVQVAQMESELRAVRERVKPDDVAWQDWTDGQARDLDGLEHQAYAWLDENRMNPGAKPFMPRVLNLLETVQTEHQVVIAQVHQRNLDVWTPDRESLGVLEQGRLQQAWNSLRAGNGLIRTPGGAGGGAADQELRAMHARLLSRPAGRDLLYTLLDLKHGDVRNKPIDINFTPPDTRSAEDKANVRRLTAELKTVTARFQRAALDNPEREALDDRRRNLISSIDELSGGGDAAKARALDKPSASISGNGTGSPSSVDVRTGTRDSDDLSYDLWGNVIPAPAFIQYGHELIHALHFRNAQDRTVEDYDRYAGGRWTDREEHQTIKSLVPGAVSENALRAEHGITGRFGHTGVSRDEWQRR